jgi:hypothetical protein
VQHGVDLRFNSSSSNRTIKRLCGTNCKSSNVSLTAGGGFALNWFIGRDRGFFAAGAVVAGCSGKRMFGGWSVGVVVEQGDVKAM